MFFKTHNNRVPSLTQITDLYQYEIVLLQVEIESLQCDAWEENHNAELEKKDNDLKVEHDLALEKVSALAGKAGTIGFTLQTLKETTWYKWTQHSKTLYMLASSMASKKRTD